MEEKRGWKGMSPMRRAYFIRLIGRCIVFVICFALCFLKSDEFAILEGWNFFRRFSVLHILWGIWLLDMLQQLMPVRHHIPLGSQKLFKHFFRPIREKVNKKALKEYILSTSRAASRVMVLWCALIAVIGILRWQGVINDTVLFMCTVAFYVCDLICVLIWCPFRLIMRNRCCTTCRIFNWDHLMMFSPMLFVKSFYSWSLFAISLCVFLLWEACVLIYPERFWEQTNGALLCSNCTDKLCTQYCRKLRPRK